MSGLVKCSSISNGVLWDGAGHPMVSHQIHIYLPDTTTEVQLYSDKTGLVPLDQPVFTTVHGAVPGFMPNKSVDIFDATTGETEPGEPLRASDIIGADGLIGGPGSVGLTAQDRTQLYECEGAVTGVDDAAAINTLVANGDIHLVVTSEAKASQPVKLNDNTHLEFLRANFKHANGVNDSIITNIDPVGGNSNITVSSDKASVVDGNCQNQGGVGSLATAAQRIKNIAFPFVKVNEFHFTGVRMKDWRGWGLSPQACTGEVQMEDIEGILSGVAGTTAGDFNQSIINTADALGDVRIANIRGQTNDDFVAVVCRPNAAYSYSQAGGNCTRLDIDGLFGDCYNFRMFRLLTGDGSQIWKLVASHIHSSQKRGVSSAHIIEILGDLYVTVPPSVTQFFDMTFNDLKGGGSDASVHIASNCSKVLVNGLDVDSAWGNIIEVDTGCEIDHLMVLGTQVQTASNGNAGKGNWLANAGSIVRGVFFGSEGTSLKSLIDNTGGTLDNASFANFNHGACTGPVIAGVGTMTNGPSYRNVMLGGVLLEKLAGSNRRGIIKYASADQTLNNTSWTALAAGGGFDITLAGCLPGMMIHYIMSGQYGAEAVRAMLDVFTMVSGSPVQSIALNEAPNNAHNGFQGWQSPGDSGVSGTSVQPFGASCFYILTSADIVPTTGSDQEGTCLLRPYFRTSAAVNKTLKGTTPPLFFQATLIG